MEFLILSSAKSQALKKYMCQGVYRGNLQILQEVLQDR